jgi:hypothetical protein
MKNKFRPFSEELVRYVFHPMRLLRLCEKNHMDLDEYVEIVG